MRIERKKNGLKGFHVHGTLFSLRTVKDSSGSPKLKCYTNAYTILYDVYVTGMFRPRTTTAFLFNINECCIQ